MVRHDRIAAVIAAGVLAGCGGGAARVGDRPSHPRVLTLLSPVSFAPELSAYAGEVAKASGGSLRLRIVYAGHGARIDYEAATIRDVRRGRADLAAAGTRAWDEFGVRGLDAFNAPLLIDSYALQQRVLRSDVTPEMLGAVRPLGLVGLGILPGPLRKPLAVSGPAVAPADFRGLSIGVQQSRVADQTMSALGARSVRLPADASLRGINGVELNVLGFEGSRLDVPGSHITSNLNFWPRAFVVVANARAYSRLTSGERRVLQTAAVAAIGDVTTVLKGLESEAAADICRHGNATLDTASPAELQRLRRRVDGVYRDLERDSATRAAIAAIERIKRDLAQPSDGLAPCHRTAPATTAARTPLDGTWRMDTSSASDPTAENWGRWTFVFDRGRFAITQENKQACTWGYGSYSVSGHRTTWRFAGGGGEAPNNAENKPGEEFFFSFSAYRDTLTLSPVKGQISPLNFRVKPWRRLSSTPSPERMSHRCPPPAAALAP